MNITQIRADFNNFTTKLNHSYQYYITKRYTSIVLDISSTTQHFDHKTKFNIIISPSFYWVKELSLPTKDAKEAIKFASSVFDFLPNNELYEYKVFKQNDSYVFIAYNPQLIIQKITDLEIPKDKIKNIFFAQSEFTSLEAAIKITSKTSIALKDGIVFAIPNELCNKFQSYDEFIFEHYFSNNSFNYDEFEEDHIDNQTMITTWILMVFTIVILLANWFILNKEIKSIQTTKDEIIKKYDIPNNLPKIIAIKNSLLKKEQKQLNIRQKVNYIMGLNLEETGITAIVPTAGTFIAPGTNDLVNSLSSGLEDKEYIQELDIKNSELLLKLSMKDDKRAEYIKDYLKQKFKIESIDAKNKIVTARLKL